MGYGTFAPLQLRQYQTGELHEEQYEIGEEAAGLLNNRTPGSRLLAVGTTTLRAPNPTGGSSAFSGRAGIARGSFYGRPIGPEQPTCC